MSNVYTIGVRMVMDSHNAIGAIAQLSAHFVGLNRIITQAQANMNRFRLAIGGAVAATAGFGMIEGVKKVVDHGAEILKLQNQMTAGGWKQTEIAEATAKAWELSSKYQSIGASQFLEMEKEMSPVLGDRHHAMEIAEIMGQMMVNLQGVLGAEKGASFIGQIRDAVRSGEMSGNAMQPERFAKYMDMMGKVLTAFGGTLTPHDFMMATKYGRASALSWSDDFTSYVLPTIMQQLGGSSSGTAFMSMFQAIVGGHMQQSAIPFWDKLGLLDPSQTDPKNLTPEHRFKHWDASAMKGLDLFKTNPYEWAQQVLVPAMLAHGVMTKEGWAEVEKGHIKDGEGAKARNAIVTYLTGMFSNRTAQGMADVLTLEVAKIVRDSKLLHESMGNKAGANWMLERDYNMNVHAFHVQWENLLQSLGSPMLPGAVEGLKSINGVLAGMSQFAFDNPEKVRVIGAAVLSIGAALVIVGTAMLAFAVLGSGGLLAAAALAVVTFVATLAAMNWDWVKQKFTDLKTWLVGSDEHMDENGGYHAKQKGLLDRGADWINENINAPYNKAMEAVRQIAVDAGLKIGRFVTELVNDPIKVMSDIGNKMRDAILALPGMVAGAIGDAFAQIGAKIKDAVMAIPGMIGGWLGFGGGNGIKNPSSFTPPPASGGGATKINTAINIDGRKVAEAVTYHQLQGAQTVMAAATYDGLAHHTPVDASWV